MKKFLITSVLSFLILLSLIICYLTIFGHKTSYFNSLLEEKISVTNPNTKITLNEIKIKIDLKKLGLFVTTNNPDIKFFKTKINISKINAYINLRSLISGDTKIDKVYIASNDTSVKEIKNIIKYLKPSNYKKYFLNNIGGGKVNFNLDLKLKNNKIHEYELSGFVKNFYSKDQKINLSNMSFVYFIKKNYGEVDKLRGILNGIQINSGNIKFENTNNLKLTGSIKADVNLNRDLITEIIDKKKILEFEDIRINGFTDNIFKINFDQTLKIIDYKIKTSGYIKNSHLKFKSPKILEFFVNPIETLSLEKTDFEINYNKNGEKIFDFRGFHKLNNKSSQKFSLKNINKKDVKNISLEVFLNNEFKIPLINLDLKDRLIKIVTNIETNKKAIKIKKLLFNEGKSSIEINKLTLINQRMRNFNNIKVKTFKDGQINNDFVIKFGKKITIQGSKYDATNLTKFLQKRGETNFFDILSKEITVNINEISTKVSDPISKFTLIGRIEKGKFNKIVSKGEFNDNEYIEISLREDKKKKKKVLEIYSDKPKPLLNNYKFFNGLIGGKFLLNTSYDTKVSDSRLVIENFKVINAPGLVKLLSLADFGGMVDALSGEGLSFERLEMKIDKNEKILNLKELYAIGPSISILMDGYVESKTGLISLRGTMVPAKTINKFLSKLPVVGDILIPKEVGEGLFGISFKIKGLPGKTKISVNPIKSLTPRFIQKALKKPK